MILDTSTYELSDGVLGFRQDKWKLTKSEMRMLKLLADNEIHENKEIFKACEFFNDNTTRVAIYRLKKKIPVLEIENINGVGYRLKTLIKVK